MTQQWLRSLSLSIGGGSGGTTITSSKGGPGLRVRFQTKQGDVRTPNSAFITITNLSEATANTIQKEYTHCTLQVGYGDQLATIFNGEIVQKRKGQETPVETYVTLLVKESQQAYSYGVISKALAAGHTFRDQVDACLEALKPYGVVAGFIADLGSTKMPRGRSLFGMVKDQLRVICQSTNTSWSIQGNQLQIVKNDQYVPGDAVVLNSRTGLIGMPVQTLGGIEVRCLLNPQIKPGRRLQIDQASIQEANFSVDYTAQAQNSLIPERAADGFYKVITVEHTGDTRGTEWYSDIVCLSVTGKNIPPNFAANGVPVDPPDQ